MDGRPYSSKGLMECYRRAEAHWERRHEVRARSDEIWKRGDGDGEPDLVRRRRPAALRVGTARLGRRARTSITAMQDIGTGTRTAMAMIAAEELGLPLDQVERRSSETRRAARTRRSRPARRHAVDGAGRALAAADAARQVLELAAQRFDARAAHALAEGRQHRLAPTAARGRWARSPACSTTARSSARARAARTRPACACSRSAIQRRRGRGRRRAPARSCRAGRRDPRRRPHHQPARRAQPGRGRDHPGARPHALGGAAASTRRPGRS